MKYSKIIYIIAIILLVSIFYIPEIIRIYKIKKQLKNIEISIDDCKTKKLEYQIKIKDIQNQTEELEYQKKEESENLTKLVKLNYLYMEGIDEEKSDSYFQSHKLIDYFNNRSNIFLTSSIIKDQSDIDFIYDKIITSFYGDDTEYYILGPPCYKATIDSIDPYIFHKRCNKIGNSIILIKTNKTRLGGITEYSWDGTIDRIHTEYEKTKTRLFNLDNKNIFLYNKNKSSSRNIRPLRTENYYFAIFGSNDLYLGYLPWEGHSAFPQHFSKSNNTEEDFNDLMNQKIERYPKNKEIKFEYEEIEVYPINIHL